MGYGSGVRSDGAGNNSEAVGLGGRVTFTPIKDKTKLVHLGISGANEFDVERFSNVSSRYEANLADSVTLLDVDGAGAANLITDAEDLQRLGVEAAFVSGPFSLQAEYLQAEVESTAAGDPEFGGYYLMASYFLTGETRPYKSSNGTFDRVKPIGKNGAWEIAARAGKLEAESDLVEKNEIDNITLGMNYYFNPQVRAMVNLTKSDIDRNASPGVSAIQAEPKTLAFRIQYDF